MANTVDADATVWGIHAGKTGDADSLFLKQGCVAIGWPKMGELSALKPEREAFKARLAAVYPEAKPGAIPTNGGQMFRFVPRMKQGDVVAYPSKADRRIHIGIVTGAYVYKADSPYPNQRGTNWIRSVPRT